MNINEYQELAMTTLNPELSKRDVLINSVMGLCGESGEERPLVYKPEKQECDGQKYSFAYPLPGYGVAVFEY